jgi:hypothetical protein
MKEGIIMEGWRKLQVEIRQVARIEKKEKKKKKKKNIRFCEIDRTKEIIRKIKALSV